MEQVFFGAEVEAVMVDKVTGKPVPMTLIAPIKDAPTILPTGEAVHADCSGAETASTPHSTAKAVLESLHNGFNWWKEAYPHLSLEIIPVATYDEASLSHDDWRIGCSPSMNVWPEMPPTPSEYKDGSRCYGLHITFDLPDTRLGSIEQVVKALDYCLALWCQENSPCPELDKRRRDIGYGRPGEFRLKYLDNGKILLEYRTLPNWAYVHLEKFQKIISLIVFDDEYLDNVVDLYSRVPDFWKKMVKGAA